MATRLAETLLTPDADMSRIHRRVVRAGAAAAWFGAAVLLSAGFVTGNAVLFTEALGPILVAGFMTALIVFGREDGGVALLVAASVTIVMHAVTGSEVTLLPAAVGLVVISSIGMLLINEGRLAWVGAVAFVLFVTPQFWSLPVLQALQLGTVMALAFGMTSAIFLTIRSAATVLSDRFQAMFENSPTAVLEEDWSSAVAYLRAEYTGRPERIRAFLLAYPAVANRAIERVRLVRANQASVQLLEAGRPEELQGYRVANSASEGALEPLADILAAFYLGQLPYEHEVHTPTLSGRSIWLQARYVDASSDGSASTVLVGLADITHMRAREDAMAELVKAKDEFIAKVSHELRTPLTAVVGLTSEMNDMASLSDSEQAELMKLVASQANEMSYIVEDLLVAARADTGMIATDSEVVDLEAELRTTIDVLGVQVHEVPQSAPRVFADSSRVRQIFRNLLTNAERYGGPRTRISCGETPGRVWLEVRDDGEGVPEEHAERIFEPYSTAHSGNKGSVGLGLSVARQLAELMDGSLTYHRDGGETVFRLELPASDDSTLAVTSNTAAF